MGHLDEDALLRFVQHQLSPEALARAEAHLRACSFCRRAVALLAETEAQVPDSPGSPPSAGPPPSSGPPGARPSPRGKQIDRYVVLEVLGAGSMGIVYAAFDPQLDRKIALKMLAGDSADHATNTEKRARMMREAQAMARLSHPNVVHVHDVGTFQDQIFVAMELIQGQSLKKWLESGRRTWREVLHVFIRAGRGLAAAHAAGMVHRDFKPDNVMVGTDGVARVMDFGLVSSVAGDPHAWKTPAPLPLDASTTGAGPLLGTPAYMAPEQWMGDQVDHRADQFSFCVSLYEALYGQRPFEARTLGELTSRVAQGKIREVPPGSPVPFYIRRAVIRGLAADPGQRHPSMKELLDILELGLRVPRRRVLIGAGAAALLVAAGLLAPGAWRERAKERCGRAADDFAAAWDGPRQRALSEVFLGAGGPAAVEAWVHAETFIDRFRDRWIASRDRACREVGVPEALAAARVECLDRQLDELLALADVLGKPDAQIIRGAALAASSLPIPEDCARTRDLGGGGEATDGPGRELRRELARARATLAAGSAAGARRLAEGALERAKEVDRALEAEALLAAGAAEVAAGEGAQARATLARAMVAAEGAGHSSAAAEAAVALAELLGAGGARGLREQQEQAEFFASLADAELEQLGEDGSLRARVELANARRLLDAGDAEGAVAPAERALAILQRRHGEEHPVVAAALGVLGRVRRERGQAKEALASHRAAVRSLEQSLGRNHPAVAGALVEEAGAQLALGNARAAVALCERAVAVARSGGGGPALAEAEALLESARRGGGGAQ